MEKSNNNRSSEPVTKADLGVMKTEIIAAVKDSVRTLAPSPASPWPCRMPVV
jgi:hypothetical protein